MNLLFPSFILIFFGLFNLLGINSNFFLRQIFSVFIGVFIFLLVKKIGRFFFIENSKFFYWLFIFILIFSFLFGMEVKGSRRWIDLFFFQFQPSEIFKVFFILQLANLFSKNQFNQRILFFKSLIYCLIPAIIVFKQPDLGNTIVYFFIYFILLLFSNLPKKIIVQIFLLMIILMPILWQILADYQKARILAFINPHIDRHGVAYNMNQAIITIGSGRFFGKGLGMGTQSKLRFLPENKTDFAFASMVEQFGFFGGLIVITCFGLIFYFLLVEIWRNFSQDKTRFYYQLGILSYLFIQFLVNVGMNLGILPITGITLPFVSYGGSSMITLFLAIALI